MKSSTARRLLVCLSAVCPIVVWSATLEAVEPIALADQAWLPKALPLPKASGDVIRVSTVEELFRAAQNVKPGGTILVADGHYMMPRYFAITTDGVTLRSASGDRRRVVLDGAQSRHGELLGITACSGVTIADLTIQNVKHNGVKLNSNTNVQEVTVRNCVIHNVWQRGIKGVRVPESDPGIRPPTNCRVQYCLFYNDRAKRFTDDEADTPNNFNGNYVGGMDIMYARSWTISDNVFIGIHGRTGEARGAVFLWHDSEDCIVQRNVIIDCDTGICLGNSHRAPGTEIHCTRCTVRNNFLTRVPENGILADYTRDCTIAHNTVHDPTSRLGRLIRVVHDNDGLVVVNNLLGGPPVRVESTSRVEFLGNVTARPDNSPDDSSVDWFADARRGNLHLRRAVPGATDAADRVERVARDFDGQLRSNPVDVGADEFR